MKTNTMVNSVGECSKGDLLREQKETGSEGVLSKDLRPPVLGWCWGLGDDPELTAGVVDDAHGLAMGRGDRPTAAREIHLVVRVAAAAVVDRDVQVEHRRAGDGLQGRHAVLQSTIPLVVGGHGRGPANGAVEVVELGLKDNLGMGEGL